VRTTAEQNADDDPARDHATADCPRLVLVTGGGRGIGRAIALAFAAQGDQVAILARTEAELAETLHMIQAAGSDGLALTADVTDREAVRDAHAQILKALGAIDVLVNNAGIGGPIGPLWDVDAADWWRTLEVNLQGTFNCTHAVLPAMIERGAGRIINLASHAGAHRWPFVSSYAVAKSAIIKLTENLAAETRDRGIAAFAIHPGTVEVGPTAALLAAKVAEDSAAEKVQAWFQRRIAAGDAVPPETAADLVTVIASGRADALSGRYISVEDDIEQLIACADDINRRDLRVLKLDA
jgi:NAD(P)-dependent dehydrogenase (short-subunit alcohol dehydrogenase family)